MNWAVYVILGIYVLNLGLNLGKHGEPKDGEYNFFTSLIATGIMMFLYYKAGLFG